MAYEDEIDPGFLTRAFSNPWVSLPFAITSGLAAGVAPRTTRGLHSGLQFGLAGEKDAYEREKEKRLSQAMDKISGLTEPTAVKKVGLDPAKTEFSLSDQNLDNALSGFHGPIAERDIPAQPTVGMPGNPLAPPRPLPAHIGIEERPVVPPVMQQYLQAVGRADPGAAARMLGEHLTKAPPSPHFDRDPNTGELVAINPRTLQPTVIRPGQQPRSYEQAMSDIPENLPEGAKVEVPFGTKGGKISREGPKEEKEPPAMSEVQAIAIEGKVNRGVPLNKRELRMLGTDDPAAAKAIVQEMARIKQSRQVDMRTALAEAVAAMKQGQMTGKESTLFKINDKGQIVDAVSEGLPEPEALKKGYRKLATKDIDTIKKGEAALESLDDFEASARRVLSKDPGIANMTWQQLQTWFKGKQSDDEVILFQTQMTRSLPLMIQSLGLSGSRAGVRLLEIERAALPNSSMTLGAALKLLERDRKTIRAVQKSVVSGEFGGKGKEEGGGGKAETPEEKERRLKEKFGL